jgi:hypothetical protein
MLYALCVMPCTDALPAFMNNLRKIFKIRMREPLTPDEDAVFLEFKRRDVKPGEEAKVINLIAESCNMSYGRTLYAARSLFKKGYLYNLEDEKEPDEIRMREILRHLLLNDPEIKELLRMGIVEERK